MILTTDFYFIVDVITKFINEFSYSSPSSFLNEHIPVSFLSFTETIDSEEFIFVGIFESSNQS